MRNKHICFYGEMKKYQYFGLKTLVYLELYILYMVNVLKHFLYTKVANKMVYANRADPDQTASEEAV